MRLESATSVSLESRRISVAHLEKMTSQKLNLAYAARIQQLIDQISQEFENLDLPDGLLVADGLGDDSGRERINEAFGKIPWTSVPEDVLTSMFDATDLSHHVSARGFCYYLPAFMRTILKRRNFGWFERLLVPPVDGFEDVAKYFGDGSLYPYDSAFVGRQRERILYAFNNFGVRQRSCVADYIGIAENYSNASPTPEFLALLKKYTNFWRQQ